MLIYSQNLWKRHEFLAESHRKSTKIDAAMATIADGLLAAPGHLTSAVEFWAKLKGDIVKSIVEKPCAFEHLSERYLLRMLDDPIFFLNN